MRDRKAMLGGIFVGGASRRMGQPKALLAVDAFGNGGAFSSGRAGSAASGKRGSTSVLERTVAVVRHAGLTPVLVGRRPELPELEDLIRALDVPVLRDAASDAGPLGGLVALLEAARDHTVGGGSDVVLALPCDLPEVQPQHLARLLEAPSAAPIVAVRRGGGWEPLAARYSSGRVLPIARRRLDARQLALQGLLDEVGATELTHPEGRVPGDLRWLDDWDTPEDVLRSRSRTGTASP